MAHTDSIDDWLKDGTTATIYCHNPRCRHKGQLDLAKLKARLGGDHYGARNATAGSSA